MLDAGYRNRRGSVEGRGRTVEPLVPRDAGSRGRLAGEQGEHRAAAVAVLGDAPNLPDVGNIGCDPVAAELRLVGLGGDPVERLGGGLGQGRGEAEHLSAHAVTDHADALVAPRNFRVAQIFRIRQQEPECGGAARRINPAHDTSYKDRDFIPS